LSGRRALVTGSGTGIGHGIARELARQGADVAIHYAHSADGAESLRAEIQEVGRRVAVLPADLSQPRACRRLVDDTVAALGALAIDLAPKRIRVNAVAPGLIEVPRYFDMPGYSRERTAARVPWGRMGEPADVARVVAFLVSPAADYVTGQLLYVDGGINARMGVEWPDAEPGR